MEFGLLMREIPIYISCKFEMYIFKIALVISENLRIAFLYVLSICAFKQECQKKGPNQEKMVQSYTLSLQEKGAYRIPESAERGG